MKLGDVSSILMGQAPPGGDCNLEQNGVPFVKVGNFGNSEPLIEEWTTNPKRMASKSDVLICVVGATCGKLNFGIECAIGRSVAAIRPERGKLDRNYLFHYLKTWVLRLRENSQGSAQGVITRKMLERIPIPNHTIREQIRIAAILDKADEIEEKTEKSNEIRAELKNSIFFDLFGDLSINPHDFPEYDLSEIADFQEGPGILAVDFHDEGIPLLRLKGIENEFATLDGCNYLLPEKVELKWKHFCVQKGDILIGSSASVGRVAIVDDNTIGAIPYTGIIRFRINEKLVNQTFLLALLCSDVFIRQVTRMSTGSTIKHFGPTHLKKVRLPVPPLNLQNELDKLFSSLSGIETTDVLAKVNSQSLSQNLLT